MESLGRNSGWGEDCVSGTGRQETQNLNPAFLQSGARGSRVEPKAEPSQSQNVFIRGVDGTPDKHITELKVFSRAAVLEGEAGISRRRVFHVRPRGRI